MSSRTMCGISYNINNFGKFTFQEKDFPAIRVSFVTSELDSSVMNLSAEIDKIYNECDDEIKESVLDSYFQAKKFLKYLNYIESPNVLLSDDNYLAFTWDTFNVAVSVVFRSNNTFTYSIVTKDSNDFGVITQTVENQRNFVERLSEVL